MDTDASAADAAPSRSSDPHPSTRTHPPAREVLARLSIPCQALPEHEITLAQITERHAQLYPHLANPAKSLGISTGYIEASRVAHRRWVRPLDRVLGPRDLDAAFAQTFETLCELAAQAASRALDQQRLSPRDIAAVVVSSTTGWRMPGVEVSVMNALGLPQSTRRVAGTTYGCAGAPWAAQRAWEQLALFPEAKVLVLSAEAFSLTQHADDRATSGFVYRGIAADGVFACVAGAEIRGPALRLHGPALELTVPGSMGAYEMTTGSRGLVFESDRESLQWLPKAMPAVREWLGLERQDAWPLDVVISHTGGLRIMQTIARELNLPHGALRHAEDSFAQRGNMASGSVWDVAGRTLADPPAPGTRGLMIAPGPGFSVVAMKISTEG